MERCPVCEGTGEVEWGEATEAQVSGPKISLVISLNYDEAESVARHAEFAGELVTQYIKRLVLEAGRW